MWDDIVLKLSKLYTPSEAKNTLTELQKLISNFESRHVSSKKRKLRLDQSSIALITYADTFISPPEKPLKVLAWFAKENTLQKVTPIIHILPFYPWDTDRGFSVTDFYNVESEYGDWVDIRKLAKNVNLMFDFVINHA